MADRIRAELRGDDVLLVIKGKVGPELAVTIEAKDLIGLSSELQRAHFSIAWRRWKAAPLAREATDG